MNINTNELKIIEKAKQSSKAFADSTLLSSFLAIIDNIIVMGSKMNNIEMAMFSSAIDHWLTSRGKKKSNKKCSLGTIIEVEYGLSYKTETPYRHSGLVIKEYQNKVLVVPCTSHQDFLDVAYHPIDNPEGNKNYRKVGKEDNFDHDCVLVLDDLKIISKNRILSTCGKINMDLKNCAYNETRNIIFHEIFKEEIQEYEEKICKLNNIIDSYKQTVHNKKGIIDSLYKKIEAKDKYIEKLKTKK